MADPIPTVVVDDHPLFRSGTVDALARTGRFDVVGEAGSAAEALEVIEARRPSLVVLDLALPDRNGFEVLATLRDRELGGKILIVSMHDDAFYRRRAEQLGAAAYVSKSAGAEPLIAVATAVLGGAGFHAWPPASEGDAEAELPPTVQEGLGLLSPTEREVLRLLATNLTSREIAAELGVSVRTVQNHRAHICQKLELRGPNRLLEVALHLRQTLGDAL